MTLEQNPGWKIPWPRWALMPATAAAGETKEESSSFWQTWRNRGRASRLAKRAQTVGRNLRVHGRLKLIQQGTLIIGNDCRLISEYQPLRLAIGRNATLEIGDGTVINSAILAAQTGITIGKNCRLGPFVHFMDSDFHGTVDRREDGESAPIVIGDNVRLGAHTLVLRGVTIGAGAEVLPGSVVTKDIAAGVLAGGVPARMVDPPPAPPSQGRET